MDQAVEDGVGVGGVADQRVPLIDGKLAGDDGRATTVAVLEDLQEVVTGGGVERLEAPVVENDQIDAAERSQQTGVAAVAAREGEFTEQPRHALIQHRAIIAAGLVAECRSSSAARISSFIADLRPTVGLSMRKARNYCSRLYEKAASPWAGNAASVSARRKKAYFVLVIVPPWSLPTPEPPWPDASGCFMPAKAIPSGLVPVEGD